jgi:hypothetical protein
MPRKFSGAHARIQLVRAGLCAEIAALDVGQRCNAGTRLPSTNSAGLSHLLTPSSISPARYPKISALR